MYNITKIGRYKMVKKNIPEKKNLWIFLRPVGCLPNVKRESPFRFLRGEKGGEYGNL
jgi:hypothetical protein